MFGEKQTPKVSSAGNLLLSYHGKNHRNSTLLELKSDRCSAVAVPVALSLPQRAQCQWQCLAVASTPSRCYRMATFVPPLNDQKMARTLNGRLTPENPVSV